MLKKRYYPIIAAVVFGMTLVLFSSNVSAETPPFKADIDIVLPNIETPKSHVIEVGESLIVAGLPFPLHMLNGTELYLPEGSLEEDIRVEISLPDFSTVSEEAPMEVGFGEMVANAIKVQVFVDGELVSPYYFAEPVELTLPIPNKLPAGIGEDVSQFILAYMDDEGEGIDTEEIKTVFRDEINKFVRAEVGHFSNIVLTTTQELTPAEQEPALPAQVSLDQNYPNPFNPVTIIGFELPEQSDVRLDIVNILGQTVAVLENGVMTAGAHQVSWDASDVPSGVYLYRLQVNDDQTLTRSMTLMK